MAAWRGEPSGCSALADSGHRIHLAVGFTLERPKSGRPFPISDPSAAADVLAGRAARSIHPDHLTARAALAPGTQGAPALRGRLPALVILAACDRRCFATDRAGRVRAAAPGSVT